MRILTAVLLLFFLFAAPSTADINSVEIQSKEDILFSEFEYSHTGYVSVSVSSVGISSTSNSSQPADPSRIGFFLYSHELSERYPFEIKPNPDMCALDIKNITVLFTFQDLSPPPHASFNTSYHVTYPGKYSLYFANCNNQSLVTMNLRTELYNVADDGTTKDYLSAGQPQPYVYFGFFLVYLYFLGFWVNLCFKNQKRFQMIHLLMAMLIWITVLHFICSTADQHDLKVTGTHHGWYILFNIFKVMRNVLLYTVLVLTAAGWSFRKRVLPDWEIILLTILILVRVLVNVGYILVGESGPYYEDWLDLKHMIILFIDTNCCVVVFFHTAFFSDLALTKASDTSNFGMSLSLTDVYSLMVFVCLLIMVLQQTVLQESSSLVFYMVMFYMYRPSVLHDVQAICSSRRR
ncbi:protein CANDIDATE G-PROTEIN COUPLED RECEPTOR 7 [Lactuca sativa]|uniref:protein CANDIDATE G-PROTEIN COUPLED RECEPTOR 7 n=1 Tax=Lactuca sativa TaxID=4236 RepID=UPI000CA73342|nr:protein CANDIDATE G-PROTEIN COUPLED RECEPTOR 7 [Lactuca sativa]